MSRQKQHQQTAEVVSIDQLRYQRDTHALAHKNDRTRWTFDFNSVTRHSSGPDHVDSLDDPIRLTAQGETDIRRIFWAYGLRRVPETWGQLYGNFKYCQVVQLWLMSFADNQPDYIKRGFHEQHEKDLPGRGDMLVSLAAGDLDAVWRFHEKNNTFIENGRSEYWCKQNKKPR